MMMEEAVRSPAEMSPETTKVAEIHRQSRETKAEEKNRVMSPEKTAVRNRRKEAVSNAANLSGY